MKASDYLPNLYKNNVEMLNIINSEEIEFENKLKNNIENNFKDTFIVIASESGIEKYEKILNIISNKDYESLNFRRDRVLNRLTSQIPFTENFLKNKLNGILGEGNWHYTIDYNNYTLLINIMIPGSSWLKELNELFKKIIPCNIDYTIEIFSVSWQQVYESYPTWESISDYTWEYVMGGEWLNG